MTGLSPDFYSENIEMYLVTIARLSRSGEPVPLSSITEMLEISAVSANEMCRKLHENRLVHYQPYKGVVLTDDGSRKAHQVLRCHRIWEVFLVSKLGFHCQEAHRIACQLEHVTSARLANLLFEFLGKPLVNPSGDVIPPAEGELYIPPILSLAHLATGQKAVLQAYEGKETQLFFEEQGIYSGFSIEVLAKAKDFMLIQSENVNSISLTLSLANSIYVLLQQS